MYSSIVKPLMDFLFALLLLLFLAPIFICTGLVLAFLNNGSVFFLQRRPGKNGKIFEVIKFKSMNDKRDEHGELLPYELRVTKFGSFIRNYSLDEIPQLINVAKGDMSLVGPRPLLEQYLPLYNAYQKRRHNVKPGITGWAQINGRNAIDWNQKFALDVWYTENISFLLDVRILFMTAKKVLFREDVNNDTNVTMPIFMGNE